MRRHVEAESLRGSQIDHHLELGGLHHRQIGWLRALENATGIKPCVAMCIREAGSVARQTASRSDLTPVVNRWYGTVCRQRDEAIAIAVEKRVGSDNKRDRFQL